MESYPEVNFCVKELLAQFSSGNENKVRASEFHSIVHSNWLSFAPDWLLDL